MKFTEIKFSNPSAIEFVGYVPKYENYAFRVIGDDGKDTGIIGEFAPHDLRNTKVFPCYGNGIEDGVSRDERIVATLLCLAYPKGVNSPVADFKGIDRAVAGKVRLPLLSEDDAVQVCSYQPFDEEWFNSKIGND